MEEMGGPRSGEGYVLFSCGKFQVQLLYLQSKVLRKQSWGGHLGLWQRISRTIRDPDHPMWTRWAFGRACACRALCAKKPSPISNRMHDGSGSSSMRSVNTQFKKGKGFEYHSPLTGIDDLHFQIGLNVPRSLRCSTEVENGWN